MPDPSGWMPDVDHIPASEWGYADIAEDGMYPQVVINHVMQGFKRTMDDWARSPQPEGKSATFGVDRAGNITQYAGGLNAPTAEGQVMVGRYGLNPNKWSVGIEQEGFSQDPIAYDYDYLYGQGIDAKGRQRQPWPEAMVKSVIAIHQFVFNAGQWLQEAQDKADRVMTHSQFDTRTRPNDPGQPWIETVRPRIVAALLGTPEPPSGEQMALQHLQDIKRSADAAEAALR
jgi:hypothetical protein